MESLKKRLVHRVMVPLAMLGAVALLALACDLLFGAEVAAQVGFAALVVVAFLLVTPLGKIAWDYFKYEVLSQENDPLRKRSK